MLVASVDGCRAGWFVILRELGSDRSSRVLESFSLVARLPECPPIVAVDIPIGLLEQAERGGRECDRRTSTARMPRTAIRVFVLVSPT